MTDSLAVASKQQATLHLVRKILGVDKELNVDPQTYNQLSNGYAMYAVLSGISPATFRDREEMAEMSTQGSSTNWVLRKGNILTLMRHMNEYAVSAMGAPSDFNLMTLVNAGVIASSAVLMGTEAAAAPGEDEGEQQLGLLTDLFVVMVVLCGLPDVMTQVKSLDRSDQVILSNTAKNTVTMYAMKPMRRYETPSAVDGRSASTHRTALTSKRNQSVLRPHAGNSNDTSPSSAPLLMGDADNQYYRNATVKLRRELEDLKGKFDETESRYQLAEAERRSWENKYRLLLAEQGSRPATKETEDLERRIARKDGSIQSLTKMVEEQQTKLSAFKEATQALEQALTAMKQKNRINEEALIAKSNERRDALEKLSLEQDKLAVQMQARRDLENEVEELTSQLSLIHLTQQQTAKEEEEHIRNSSFGSNGSFDRVLQLENEIDEIRHQRDSLQKQLHALQRQVSTIPAHDGTAAHDTLKAQVRQLEKEKANLQQQLSAVQLRLEDLESNNMADNSFSMNSASPGDPLDASALNTRAVASSNQDHLRKLGEHSRRDHALLSSLLLQYGYRNLILQQHELLLHDNIVEADAARAERHRISSGGVSEGSSGRGSLFTGSLLSRQRHEVEQGLLESIIQGRKATLPRQKHAW